MSHNIRTPEETALLKEFFGSINKASREGLEAGNAARPAIERLAAKCYENPATGQGSVLLAFLASLYNSAQALPVRLDELRRLDWTLREDVVLALRGIGCERCPDTVIRDAFLMAGGPEAVEWFVSEIDGTADREALTRLVDYALDPANNGATTIRAVFRSFYAGEYRIDLAAIGYLDRGPRALFMRVLDAFIGERRGQLSIDDLTKILKSRRVFEEFASPAKSQP